MSSCACQTGKVGQVRQRYVLLQQTAAEWREVQQKSDIMRRPRKIWMWLNAHAETYAKTYAESYVGTDGLTARLWCANTAIVKFGEDEL